MRWIVSLLLVVVGGYMTFDGMRALTVGDYLTPATGEHEGELGPWAAVVEAVGIAPRSTLMKLGFVMVGAMHLVAAVAVLGGGGTAIGWFVLGAALSGLWYLPFGTAADLIAVGLILGTSLRPWG